MTAHEPDLELELEEMRPRCGLVEVHRYDDDGGVNDFEPIPDRYEAHAQFSVTSAGRAALVGVFARPEQEAKSATRYRLPTPELMGAATAYRDALRETRRAWSRYEIACSTTFEETALAEYNLARAVEERAAQSAAFRLAFEMLGDGWYQSLEEG